MIKMDVNVLTNLIVNGVYSASTMFNEKNTKLKRENRPCWAIVIKFEGETVYTSKGREYVSNINNVVILPKGCSYEWHCTESGHYSIIEFESNKESDEIFTFKIRNGEKLLNIFHSLEYSNTIKTPTTNLQNIRAVYSLLLMLLQSCESEYFPTEKEQKIAPALDFISKNYNKIITNDELAKLCSLSTVYFRKLFTKIMGTSPISYIHNLRIEKAKEMLKSDYGSITDIAFSLGYSSIYDFSRTFKKLCGIPPSKY